MIIPHREVTLVAIQSTDLMAATGRSHLSDRGLSDQSRSPYSCQLGLVGPVASAARLGQTGLMAWPALISGQTVLIGGSAAPNALQSML